MIESLIGVALGGIASWIITHSYYRKQEQSNPAPLLKHIARQVQELIDASSKDKPMQAKLKNLGRLMAESHLQVLYSLLPLSIDTQGLKQVYESGDERKFNDYLKQVLPTLFQFNDRLIEIRDALLNLQATVDATS